MLLAKHSYDNPNDSENKNLPRLAGNMQNILHAENYCDSTFESKFSTNASENNINNIASSKATDCRTDRHKRQ